MTLEEAQKVADTCSTADGGCSNCVRSLANYLQEDFPEFQWTMVGSKIKVKETDERLRR